MVHDAFVKAGHEAAPKVPPWVHESRFGDWFQSTNIWRKYVLEPAFESVAAQIGSPQIHAPARR